jgi:hypothetical protein
MANTSSKSIVDQMAKATGVAREDVKKVLSKLGIDRIEARAIECNGGKPIKLASARVALRAGRSTIIV